MFDREVSASMVVAAILWTLGAAVIGAAVWLDWTALAAVGLFAGMGGATVTVRGWLARQSKGMRDVFRLGVDAGRAQGREEAQEEGQSLRSVRP